MAARVGLTGSRARLWPDRSEPVVWYPFGAESAAGKRRERVFISNEYSNCFPQLTGAAINGSDKYQHHSYALHGWSPGRQFGTSWNSHGNGARGLLSLAAVPSLRSAGSRMAEPRSLRAVARARVHAALFPSSLDRSPSCQQRLRNSGRTIGATRCHQGVPATG